MTLLYDPLWIEFEINIVELSFVHLKSYHFQVIEDVDTYVEKEERLPTISWNAEKVGVVHSSFFWGYIITQVPSGYLASIFPPYQ